MNDPAWTVSSASVEYIEVEVEAEKNGAVFNPTADTVQWAFVAIGAEPAAGDWVNGVWETQTTTQVTGTSTTYWAMCLVGSAKVLAKGYYDAYVKVVDNPETPVKYAGVLEVT